MSEMYAILYLINILQPSRRKLHEIIHELACFGLFSNISFRKYYYGYHSEELDNWLDTLKAAGLICEKDGVYKLTEEGTAKLQAKLRKCRG